MPASRAPRYRTCYEGPELLKERLNSIRTAGAARRDGAHGRDCRTSCAQPFCGAVWLVCTVRPCVVHTLAELALGSRMRGAKAVKTLQALHRVSEHSMHKHHTRHATFQAARPTDFIACGVAKGMKSRPCMNGCSTRGTYMHMRRVYSTGASIRH